MISFKANYVASTQITKYKMSETKESVPANFVQFDLKDRNDRRVLRKLSNRWVGKSFASRIYQDFKKQTDLKQKRNPLYFYGLTLQQDNFEKLDFTQLLGITEVAPLIDSDFHQFDFYTNSDYEINYLQVNPRYKYPFYVGGYRNIGSKMIEFLRKLYSDSNLWIVSADDAIKFYKKVGFEHIEGFWEMVLKKFH